VTAEVFGEWLKRQGHRVVRTESSYWYQKGPRVFQAFPYHWLIQPSEQELNQLFRSHGAISLRYSTSLAAPVGCMSYHVTFDKPTYGFDDLGKSARKNVRRGLKNCSVEPISFDRLAEEGWALQQDTLSRQERSDDISQQSWKNLCNAASDLPGFNAWGALVSNELAASVITFQLDGCCYMLYQQCKRDFLTAHVNNALSFSVTEANVGSNGVRSVFYSLHSLDAAPTMDEFKLRMGYTAKPVRQRVIFHPWCAPLVNRMSHAVLKKLMALRGGDQILAKGEGMVRFYLEGKQPIERQPVPHALQVAGAGAEE
jgi:hypothetical protein